MRELPAEGRLCPGPARCPSSVPQFPLPGCAIPPSPRSWLRQSCGSLPFGWGSIQSGQKPWCLAEGDSLEGLEHSAGSLCLKAPNPFLSKWFVSWCSPSPGPLNSSNVWNCPFILVCPGGLISPRSHFSRTFPWFIFVPAIPRLI